MTLNSQKSNEIIILISRTFAFQCHCGKIKLVLKSFDAFFSMFVCSIELRTKMY